MPSQAKPSTSDFIGNSPIGVRQCAVKTTERRKQTASGRPFF
ncbi:hypothetical protein [Methyloglobulus morosus]|nr:hypothetical protein [Methyloglobulus morosus]